MTATAAPAIPYSLTSDGRIRTLTVLLPTGPKVITDNQLFFNDVLDALDHGAGPAEVSELLDPAVKIAADLAAANAKFGYADGKLTYCGEFIDNVLSGYIIRKLRAGESDWSNYVQFFDKLAANGVSASRRNLFRFLERYDFEITAHGDVIAYKGVLPDRTSINAGPGAVNGVKYTHAHLPNPDGAEVTIKRKLVDPDRGNPCSVGLHVGTQDYATAFARHHGGVVLRVSVNPIDAISVPSDDARKMRVCRYKVLGEV